MTHFITNQFSNDFQFVSNIEFIPNKSRIFKIKDGYEKTIIELKESCKSIIREKPLSTSTTNQASNLVISYFKIALDEVNKQIEINHLVDSRDLN